MSRIMTPRNTFTDTMVRILRPVVFVESGVKAGWELLYTKAAHPIHNRGRLIDLWRRQPWNCMWSPMSMWFRFVLGSVSDWNSGRHDRQVMAREQRAEEGKYVWTLSNLLDSLRELKARAREAGLPPK